jgi:hypothetical protein
VKQPHRRGESASLPQDGGDEAATCEDSEGKRR